MADCLRCEHNEDEHEGEYYKSCTAEDCVCSDFEYDYKPLRERKNG